MITITGTCYFPSFESAMKYYSGYHSGIQEITKICVEDMISKKEIFIGRPKLELGETLFIKDNRYHIQEGN